MLADHLEQGQPVDIFHVPIGNDQVDVALLELAQGIAAALGLDDILEPELGEDVLADTPHRLLVIDNKDADSAGFWHIRNHLLGARDFCPRTCRKH